MNVVVLVGCRPDGGWRDRLWARCESWWENDVGWPVAVGYHLGDGPFSLAAASNDAAQRAPADADLFLYAGADVLLGDPSQARRAAEWASETGQLVFAHDHYYSLSEEGTKKVLNGAVPHGSMSEWPPWPNTFSSMLAVPRRLWDEVGGFDERFVGWGFEDLAVWSACWALAGGFDRVTGPVFHLWHERVSAEREGSPTHAANEVLGRRYLAARTSRAAMLPILSEPGGPLDPSRIRIGWQENELLDPEVGG